MPTSNLQRALIFYFRICMGWTFLYAGITQLVEPSFSAAPFLEHTKTFHSFFVLFASPGVAPYTNFLVAWGHTLIGLSLIVGLFVPLSAAFGALLMVVYYFAHMNFPYIDNTLNFIMEFHLVYAGVLIYLIEMRAGEVLGLDAWARHCTFVQRHPSLQALV